MAKPTPFHLCGGCGWLYDPRRGDGEGGVAPGTPWEELPEGWSCPACGAERDEFEPVASGEFPES